MAQGQQEVQPVVVAQPAVQPELDAFAKDELIKGKLKELANEWMTQSKMSLTLK